MIHPKVRKEILKAYKNTLNTALVASKFDVSVSTVYNIVKKKGVKNARVSSKSKSRKRA